MISRSTVALVFLTIGMMGAAVAQSAASQPSPYKAPRTADGHPDINGIWQALNTANWDLQGHAASQGPAQLGAIGAIPPGLGVVEGEEIPYLPEARAKRQENFEKRWTLDPEVKCYLPGVPRATYMPYPFQIVQSKKYTLISYEYASAVRTINMENHKKAPIDSWMGWSNGRWERGAQGETETLVVDVTGFNEDTWFDRAGNYHSDALHVVERYTPRSADTLSYEATVEDPKVFSRPWKIRMILYRHAEPGAQLLEFKCVEFVEELMYGPLRKKK
jgi:hypothetical protein